MLFRSDQSLGYYSHESLTLQKTPRVLQILTRGPSSNLNSNRGGRKGGGAYQRRDCSGEVVEDVGEVSGITAMCGSPSGMVGVGRSTCAGGDARRRRGVRPAHGAIVHESLLTSPCFRKGAESRRRHRACRAPSLLVYRSELDGTPVRSESVV